MIREQLPNQQVAEGIGESDEEYYDEEDEEEEE